MENRIAQSVPLAGAPVAREVVFLSKATPGDDEFALWLAPKLEAAGYRVFTDIRTLEPGDRWRNVITSTLQNQACKMLLCCGNETLAAAGVQEEIEIGLDLAKELKDPRFVIPLRIRPYKKLFGIGGLQYIDFVRGWAEGFEKLLETLKRQKVPIRTGGAVIQPNWELYRRRGAIALKQEPERLTSNWLRISEAPDVINYFEPSGVIDRDALAKIAPKSPFPVVLMQSGFVTFQSSDEVAAIFGDLGRFVAHQISLTEFVEAGYAPANIKRQDASNVVHSMFRQAWNAYCQKRGLLEYHYSNAVGFHIGKDQTPIGKKIGWGTQGERRSSMLRNIAKGHVWQYGVSVLPYFWPFPHLKLKSRVLFAPLLEGEADDPLQDPKKQHRLRRTVCKGWRNRQWHGRLLAFLELLSGDKSVLLLNLGEAATVRVEATPLLFSSPVSTVLPTVLQDEDEEIDPSTLGRPEPEDEA
jgi:TIR domain-containing protein